MQFSLLKKFVNVYGHDIVLIRVAQSWFKCFQSRNFDVKYAHCFGQSLEKSIKSWKKLSKIDTLAVMIHRKK